MRNSVTLCCKKIEVTATVLALFSLDRAQKNDEHDIFIFFL